MVRRTYPNLQARRQRDGTQRTVRRERDIVRLGHGGYPSHFGDAAAVRDVRLDDVDAVVFEEAFEVPAAVEALAEGYGAGGQAVELFDAFRVLA